MKIKASLIVVGPVSLLFASAGFADWSLSLLHVSENPETGTGPSAGFGPSTTWHVWAHFSSPTDVLGVMGQEGQPMFLNLISGSIYNHLSPLGQHQDFPPTQAQKVVVPLGWGLDTYITIGTLIRPSVGGSHPNLAFTAGFETLINNFTGSWNTNDLPGQEGGWIAIDMPEFAHGTDLLLMQLTVSQGALFEIVFGLDTLQLGYLHDWDGISFATHGTPGSGASYLTNIPAPGTAVIAMLGLAGLAPGLGGRRRQR